MIKGGRAGGRAGGRKFSCKRAMHRGKNNAIDLESFQRRSPFYWHRKFLFFRTAYRTVV